MNIVVGYIPREEGLAAVEHATDLAVRDAATVVIVNSGVHGNDSDPSFAPTSDLDAIADRLRRRGVAHEIRQPVGAELPAEEILRAAAEVEADLIVIGSGAGRWSGRSSSAARCSTSSSRPSAP